MKHKLPLLLTIACVMQTMVTIAQPINYDKSWVQGSPYALLTQFTANGIVNTFWDSTFNQFILESRHSSICDANGDPLLVTNGMRVWDKNRNLIDNGDTLAPLYMYVHEYNTGGAQGSLILPVGDSIYYIFTTSCTDTHGYYCHNFLICNGGYDLMQYAKVDMKMNNYAGKVVDKRHTILDTFNANTVSISQMTAVRHGNGQDWWLVKHGTNHYLDSTEIYTFRVKQDTVIGPFVQRLPIAPFNGNWIGQAVFNQMGNKYATVCQGKAEVFIADFDRCTGLFSNPEVRRLPLVVPTQPPSNNKLTSGIAFSPNGSFIYICRGWSDIYQLEIDNTDSATAWYKVADRDTTSTFALYFGLKLGHDQKVYVGYEAQSWGMSFISNPDVKGAACGFCPLCLQFPTMQIGSNVYHSVRSHPNMANYALGASSTPCQPPLSVSGVGRRVDIRLYPNPTDGVITLEDGGAGGRLELRDMPGRVVWQQQVAKGVAKHGYHLGELAPGVYGWSYEGTDGSRQQGKLVVAR